MFYTVAIRYNHLMAISFFQTYAQPGKSSKHEETTLDEVGFLFIRTCIKEIENRGKRSLTSFSYSYRNAKNDMLLYRRFGRSRAVSTGRRFVQSQQVTIDGA
jgi:hypothetical protein